MNDLINRAELLKNLDECLAESDGGTPIVDGVLTAIKCAVEQMPAVDAVPVVRCGECVYWLKDAPKCFFGGCTGKDFFCSHGERRSDD